VTGIIGQGAPGAQLPALRREEPGKVPLVLDRPAGRATAAGSFGYNRLQEFGPTIMITFREASEVSAWW
jgi:hypothetical protein